ncbi:MAG: hypothetical protein VYB15_01210 [Planctomycetota bacterium]|nr:hypothetical protein [Planctomycetota bacterium]
MLKQASPRAQALLCGGLVKGDCIRILEDLSSGPFRAPRIPDVDGAGGLI